MGTHKTSLFLPIAGLLFAMLLWGTSFVTMKLALQSYHPFLVVFGRMIIASLVFLLFGKRLKQFSYQKGDWKYLLLLALCEPCLYFVFESYALLYTTSSQAGIVSASLPLMVAFAAMMFLKERLNPAVILGGGIAIAGIVLISSQSVVTRDAPNPLLGNILELIAMSCAAGYTLIARYLGTRYSAVALTAIQCFIGSVFFAPVLFLPSVHFPETFALVPSLSIVYLGSCVTVGAYSLYNYGLQKIPASQASAFINLIPVFAVLCGWIVLGERLTIFQGIGMGLVLAGVWLSSYRFGSPKFGVSSA
ncbi:EamA family transporter [candidate division KSB3 bacterium]|uniref:EamA family transporter n=1 Tax=candidate division KSB3 bacterium TaxID=2044937 RepID=A0A2G6KC96_9BACT|nr:MAG: EamA family transporter [candidate division KSB3 bacterium]